MPRNGTASQSHKVAALSSHLRDKLERIQQALADLAEESLKGVPIVVEGKKDVEALRDLGVEGPIFAVKTGGKSLIDAAEEIVKAAYPEVILFLDFDWRGRQGTARLCRELERARVRANLRFWRVLSGLARREIQCVEGLESYVETLERKAKIAGI